MLLPVLIRYGVDNGVSAGSTMVVMAASGVALAVVGADYLIQRFQMQVAGRAGENVLYQLGCASSRTCSASGSTTTSGRWPAGS